MKRTSGFFSVSRRGPKSSVVSSLTSCLAMVAALILLPPSTRAATFFVTETNDSVDFDPGDGECRGFVPLIFEGACTLRAAVMEANALPGPDVIFLPVNETFVLFIDGMGNGNSAAHGDLDIFDEVFIGTAEFGAPEFVAESEADYPLIDGSGTGDRIFDLHADAGSVTFARLRMAFGDATDATGNGRGGAINIRESVGDVLINQVDLHSNTAQRGGAIFNRGDNNVTISDSLIHDNIATENGTALVNDCGSMIIEHTSVYGNSALAGPVEAILNEQNLSENSGNCSLNIRNVSILDNVTTFTNFESRGIVSRGEVDLRFNHSTISGHDTGLRVVSVFSDMGVPGIPSLRMRNTVLANNEINCTYVGDVDLNINGFNSADDTFPIVPPPLVVDSSDSCGLTVGDDNVRATVLSAFLPGPAQDDPLSWHRILLPPTDSVLIDQGHPAVSELGCDPFDQRLVERPIDGDDDGLAQCDIGAVEVLPELPDMMFSDGFEE